MQTGCKPVYRRQVGIQEARTLQAKFLFAGQKANRKCTGR